MRKCWSGRMCLQTVFWIVVYEGVCCVAPATASLDSTYYAFHNLLHFLPGAKGTYSCTDPLDMISSFKRLITSSLSVSFLVSAAAAHTAAPLILPPLLQHAARQNCSQEKTPNGIFLPGLHCAFQEYLHSLKALQWNLGHADARGLSGMSCGGLWSVSVVAAQLRMSWLSSWYPGTIAIVKFFHLNIILLCWHLCSQSFHCGASCTGAVPTAAC